MEKNVMKFEVIEDNGGGLHLAVFNSELEPVFIATNLQFCVEALALCIKDLLNGCDTDDWEGNEIDEYCYYDDIKPTYEANTSVVVADNDGIYLCKCVTVFGEFDMDSVDDDESDEEVISWDMIEIIPGGLSKVRNTEQRLSTRKAYDKYSEACRLSKWGCYAGIWNASINAIPQEILEVLTARQIALLVDANNKIFAAGKNAGHKELCGHIGYDPYKRDK